MERKYLSKTNIALIAGAIYCFVRGIAYLPITKGPDTLPRGLELMTGLFSIYLWGLIWTAIGIFCIVTIFTNKQYIAWGVISGIMVGWGFAYLYGWGESFFTPGPPNREWLTATSYLIPGMIIGFLSNPMNVVKKDGEN